MDTPPSLAPDTFVPTVQITLECDATLGYAAIQNAVPVLRALRITNTGKQALSDVVLQIDSQPMFTLGAQLRYERLAPGESRRIAPVDLPPQHAYFADLQEAVQATLRVVVQAQGVEVGRANQALQVLAYDQWAGTRALPELLAAFCMPNHPAIDRLVAQASELLRADVSALSMDGYQSKKREVVWKQVSALYSAIATHGLQYAEPPASFGVDGQKIRTPDRILEGRVATCLDLAMLLASCLEQAGLHPVVLIKEGHAWVGVWLHAACFADPVTDDVQAVRKRVDSGELLVFETTGLAQHPSHRPSLRLAMEQGQAHLREADSFRYAVDIHRARELQIKPLPSRTPAATPGALYDTPEAPAAIEPTPMLPALDADLLGLGNDVSEDTPEGRLAKWKSKLLDLTLRNRLLNFKPTKTTLQLAAPDLPGLEDALSEGADFKLRPLPAIMEGSDPRVAQVHAQRSGRSPQDDLALAALGNKELLARVGADELDEKLLAIHSAARTGLEEGGANTLYLAVGLLQWTDSQDAEAKHLAPILLLPVTLTRQSVRSGYRLARHDDEAIVNPTLLQLLRSNFELRLPGVEVLPTDDKGVDVAKVLQAFRLAVRETPQWEVLEQAHLGLFSFTKFLMWKDLQDRTEQLKANRVVRHLIDHPGQAFAREANPPDFSRLDRSHRPQDILAPLLSDSSQLKAICAVDAGQDLVLEGPPGTGKSQTITNLIAHSLAKGKTVLFVSEKMAALGVVHRRLNAIGLGPFCLELHSSKARKTEVLQQLGQALEVSGQRTAEEWSREADRLSTLRASLNGLVDSLHKAHGNGLTVYDALGTCIAHAGQTPSPMPWADAATHSRNDLDALRETTRRLATLAAAVAPLKDHPLGLIGHTAWSHSWQDQLLTCTRALAGALQTLRDKSAAIAPHFGHSEPSMEQVLDLPAGAHIDNLARLLMAAPQVPAGLASQAFEPTARSRVNTIAAHGLARLGHWARLGTGWSEALADQNAADLKGQWTQATTTWWPKSWLDKRSLRARLATLRSDGQVPSDADIATMLATLPQVNEQDQALRALQPEAQSLLRDSFQGLNTDWARLAQHEQWAQQLSDATVLAAGGNAQRLHILRTQLQSLVAEQRVALAADAPIGQALAAYRSAWSAFTQQLAAFEALAHPPQPLHQCLAAGTAPTGQPATVLPLPPLPPLPRLHGLLAGIEASQRQWQPWCLWREVRGHAVALGLQGLVDDVEAGLVPMAQVEAHFEHSYRQWWLKKAMDADAALRGFSSADHDRKIREFRQADERFQKLTEQTIAATLAARVPAASGAVVGADSELGRLRRELQKQRRHMPVRQLVQGLPTLLPRLKPCLLMSPLSVAQYLDAGYAPFDLVVFDEASQIPVWDAVGAIARGKQLVVVGDPKQLPPTTFFNKNSDSPDGIATEEQVQDLESILDECLGAGMNRLSLQWHYRSRHESLITFSNIQYYGSSLITFPSPVTDDDAVHFERVQGVYDRGATRTNRAEADAIVQGIATHFLSPDRRALTLGVVTFNQTQQSLIETLLDARRRADPDLDRAIAANTHEPLFIKNLENVQGDERDIIFFSITYGPDAAGKTAMNFGPLNGEGGHRRLNVAISRAREGVVIYSTLLPEQIDLARVRAAGVRDLKHYLEFAIKGPSAFIERSVPTGGLPDSPFEAAVIQALRARGWSLQPQVGCSGYRLDIGVVDPPRPGPLPAGHRMRRPQLPLRRHRPRPRPPAPTRAARPGLADPPHLVHRLVDRPRQRNHQGHRPPGRPAGPALGGQRTAARPGRDRRGGWIDRFGSVS